MHKQKAFVRWLTILHNGHAQQEHMEKVLLLKELKITLF